MYLERSPASISAPEKKDVPLSSSKFPLFLVSTFISALVSFGAIIASHMVMSNLIVAYDANPGTNRELELVFGLVIIGPIFPSLVLVASTVFKGKDFMLARVSLIFIGIISLVSMTVISPVTSLTERIKYNQEQNSITSKGSNIKVTNAKIIKFESGKKLNNFDYTHVIMEYEFVSDKETFVTLDTSISQTSGDGASLYGVASNTEFQDSGSSPAIISFINLEKDKPQKILIQYEGNMGADFTIENLKAYKNRLSMQEIKYADIVKNNKIKTSITVTTKVQAHSISSESYGHLPDIYILMNEFIE